MSADELEPIEDLENWDHFVTTIAAMRNPETELLFRGQANSCWSLDTTLERRSPAGMSVSDYYRTVVQRVRPQLESLTGHAWDVPLWPEVEPWFNDYDSFSLALHGPGFPAYAYLIYARHHAFPSPLLDWSRSPYIAAYFAFVADKADVQKRSIYVWSEPPAGKGIVRGTNRAEAYRLGPYIRAHPRHVLQQNDYTMGLTCFTEGTVHRWCFTPQHASLARDRDGDQCLWKFTIPSTERLRVLRFLEDANINGFSLFGSEERLMETLAVRHFDLRDQP